MLVHNNHESCDWHESPESVQYANHVILWMPDKPAPNFSAWAFAARCICICVSGDLCVDVVRSWCLWWRQLAMRWWTTSGKPIFTTSRSLVPAPLGHWFLKCFTLLCFENVTQVTTNDCLLVVLGINSWFCLYFDFYFYSNILEGWIFEGGEQNQFL